MQGTKIYKVEETVFELKNAMEVVWEEVGRGKAKGIQYLPA